MADIQIWTPELTARLRANAFGRHTVAELSAILGVDERAIINKCAKVGINLTSKLTRVQRERIHHYAQQGWQSRIAVQVGVAPELVAIHLTSDHA